jgi:phosphomannomutase
MRDLIEQGLGEAPGGGSAEDVDVTAEFHDAALKTIDAANVKPLKVVVDGGNGMAGPMVGPLLDGLGLDLVTTYWTPDGTFPDHEPNPLLEENRQFIIDKVKARAPTWASPGTATRTAASSSTTRAASSTATS